MADRIRIFDTTLRDGEQSPGIVLDKDEKVAIAQQLARLGVDVIEAGFPASSTADADAVADVASAVRGPVVAALARAVPDDVDRAWGAVRGAGGGSAATTDRPSSSTAAPRLGGGRCERSLRVGFTKT